MRTGVRWLFVSWLLLVTACSTNTDSEDSRVVDAAVTPLSDLNLVQKKIPQILLQAQAAPHAPPSSTDCTDMLVDIRELGMALGLKAEPIVKEAAQSDEAPDTNGKAGDAAIEALRRTAEGILPMRSWIRMLTGAEKHSKEVSDAIYAGHMRRAFLHGYFHASGCVERQEIQPTVKLPSTR